VELLTQVAVALHKSQEMVFLVVAVLVIIQHILWVLKV
jgi:hypothetical protein